MSLLRFGFVLLVLSISGPAQLVVTPTNTATTPGPAIPVAVPTEPLIVTPSIALPGSGPAWSSSLPSQPAPPAMANPSAVTVEAAPVQIASPVQTQGAGQAGTAVAASTVGENPLNLGAQNYIGIAELAQPSPPPSLGEVAREYQSHTEQQHAAVKTYTNADLTYPGDGSPAPAKAQTQSRSPFEPSTDRVNGAGGNAPGLPASDQGAETAPNGKPQAGRSVKGEVEQQLSVPGR